jgi:hypothetical protein
MGGKLDALKRPDSVSVFKLKNNDVVDPRL